jgi:hypothetical protein
MTGHLIKKKTVLLPFRQEERGRRVARVERQHYWQTGRASLMGSQPSKQAGPALLSELHSTSKHTVKLWRAETLTLFCRLLMQFRGDNGNMQWKNGGVYYAAPPFYNGGYGYPAAAPFPDPGMYAAPAYGAYPFYGNQQQVS